MVLQQYHEHHNINHSSKDVNSDMDVIPILSARGDEPPLLYQHDHEREPDPTDVVHLYPPRRKRHSGNSESINSSVARFVRRRGRSVPCDTSAGIASYTANDGNGNDNSSNGYGDDAEFPQVERRRAGSAGSALAGSRAAAARANGGDLHGELPRRRRAGSSILNHFRRRHKEHAQGQNQNAYESQQQMAARRRKVHFKTTLHAEVMPNPYAQLPTYDELLFNVGGLYQTLSFLHDPMPSEDPAMTNSTGSSTDSSNSQHGLDDDLAHPPERSMQLMIAEFLYRSAVYLGYPNDSKPWIPGFRETKRFSVNDVKRWRRLAHHDWEKEEQQFQKNHEFPHGNGHRKIGIRATVSGWLHRRRRHSAPAKLAMSCPPPVSPNADLSLLVTIANSCVYCGAFQFDARDIRALCNVEI